MLLFLLLEDNLIDIMLVLRDLWNYWEFNFFYDRNIYSICLIIYLYIYIKGICLIIFTVYLIEGKSRGEKENSDMGSIYNRLYDLM